MRDDPVSGPLPQDGMVSAQPSQVGSKGGDPHHTIYNTQLCALSIASLLIHHFNVAQLPVSLT